jgi:membrane associated rhomboid family serine protease
MSPSPSRLQLRGRLTRGAAWLVGIVAVPFLLLLFGNAAFKQSMLEWLLLTPYAAFHDFQLWKLATSAVIYPQSAALALLLDGLMLFLFVPTIERWWGTKRFITFVIATSLVGNFAAAAVGFALAPGVPLFGLGPFIFASVVAFGVLFADQPVQLFGVMPIKGKSLAIGAVALQALMVLLEREWVRGAGAFAAMGLAYIMTSGGWTPNLWWLKLRKWRLRRKLGVLEGGKKPPDKQKWIN